MRGDMTLNLPYPPTVNHYYGRSRNGVFIKPEGRKYRQEVQSILARLGMPRVFGFVRLTVFVYKPDRRTRDLDNTQKALWDALSDRAGHTGIMADDKQIIDYRVMWMPEIVRGGAVQVEVTELGTQHEKEFIEAIQNSQSTGKKARGKSTGKTGSQKTCRKNKAGISAVCRDRKTAEGVA